MEDQPQYKYHKEAWENLPGPLLDSTYELVGPKVGGNPYVLSEHRFWRHGEPFFPQPPRTFDGLHEWFEANWYEGIVWHHDDG